jgi:hypothetical protein
MIIGTMRTTIKIVASSAPVPLSGEKWNICSTKFMWTSVSHHDAAEGQFNYALGVRDSDSPQLRIDVHSFVALVRCAKRILLVVL